MANMMNDDCSNNTPKIYIISPFKTLTNSVLASFIFNSQYPTAELHSQLSRPEEKINKYIIRSHTDHGLICNIFNKNEDSTIISIVRDPVSQFISGFFQDIDCPPINYGTKDEILAAPLDDIIKVFNTLEFTANETYNIDMLFKFYNDIMKFNVYECPDNDKYFTQGYNTYNVKNPHGNNIKIIIIRADKISLCFSEIGKMFGIDNIKLYFSNTAGEKWYDSLYKDFKKKIYEEKKVDKINHFMKLKYVNYFYSEEERDKMINFCFK